MKNRLLDFEIDKLTKSIENAVTGDSFLTEVSLLTKKDLKNVTKKTIGYSIGATNLMTCRKKLTN